MSGERGAYFDPRETVRPFSQNINFANHLDTFLIDGKIAVRYRGRGKQDPLALILEIACDKNTMIIYEGQSGWVPKEINPQPGIGHLLRGITPTNERSALYIGDQYKLSIIRSRKEAIIRLTSTQPIAIEPFPSSGRLVRRLERSIRENPKQST